MRRSLWVLFGVLAFSACKKDKEAEAPAPMEAARPSKASFEGKQVEDAQEPGTEYGPSAYVVTKEKLDAYVGYQRKLLEAYEALLKDMAKVHGRLQEGRGEMQEDINAAMKFIESKAKAEEEARKAAGLTEEDVNGLAEVVTAVISQRQLAQALQTEEELKKLEEMQAKLTPEQREELEPQLAAMRERNEELQTLVEVRRTYGDGNVDLVLSREADLAKNYQDMLNTFGKK
jgi:nitrous oxide reductase accessory protein NosL